MGCCQPLLCLVKAISAAVQGLKRKLISDQQCGVLGAAWFSSSLFSMELLNPLTGSVSLPRGPPVVFTSPEFQ